MVYSTETDALKNDLDTASKPRFSAGDAWLIGCSILSLLVSCILLSAHKQAWMDEIFTWKEAGDPSLWHLYWAIQHGADGGQPLFYTTVWLWRHAFGGGVLTLRLYSCVAMCAALVVTWKTIRRYYGMWSTAFGVLMIWGTSSVILDQNAEARFYGLYMLTAAIAIALYARLTEQERPSRRLLAGTLLAQAALVLTHVFGLIYSGLILLALMLADARNRRWRWKVYLAHAAGWLALLVWIPAMRASRAAGQPHGWIEMPTFHNALDAYTFRSWTELLSVLQSHHSIFFQPLRHLPQLLMLIPLVAVLVWEIRRLLRPQPGVPGQSADPRSPNPKRDLLLLAFVLLSAPALLYILSHLVTPVFVPRYFLPSAIGMAIVLAAFAERMGADRDLSPAKPMWLARVGIACILLLCPIPSALVAQTTAAIQTYLDVETIEKDIPPNLPVVVGWQPDFSRLMRFSHGHQSRYYFLLDWTAALAGPSSFVLDYHLMRAYRNAGYYAPNIQDRNAFLCAHPDFVVLDYEKLSWFDVSIRTMPGFEWKVIGTYYSPYFKRTLLAVHRKAPLPFCKQP